MNPILDFASYVETGPEKMFMILFGTNKFPSHLMSSSVDPDIIKYLNKNSELVCEYKYYANEDPQKSLEIDDMGTLFRSSGNQCELYYYKDLSIKDEPLLYRVYSTDDGTTLSLLCHNSKRIAILQENLLKKYLTVDNYDKNTYFGLLYKDAYGIKVKQLPLKMGPWDNLDIGLNYGKAFLETDKIIKTKLENDKGNLFLLHGSIGTGKSYYIKHLSKYFGNKKRFIFIPTHFAEALSSPDLIPILLRQKSSVIILEDAEKILVSRENDSYHSSSVSTLLNLSDGILQDIIDCKVIATFNTKIDKIDSAATRHGRLAYEHEFKPLNIEDSKILVEKLGKKHNVEKPMSVSEIYNIEDKIGHIEESKEERVIGFSK
jgi:hypothetical protein